MKKSYITGKFLWLASLVCLFSTFTSCENEYKVELPLATNENALTLNPSGGTNHVLVYSDGKWWAELVNEADASWAHLSKTSGNGQGEFVIDYDKNGGVTRVANIRIVTKEKTKTIKVSQTGFVEVADVYLYGYNTKMPQWEKEVKVPFRTNLGLALDQLSTKVEYGEFDIAAGADNSAVEVIPATEEEPGWLTDVTVTEDELKFKVTGNNDGAKRQARVTVYLQTGSTAKAEASTIITQEAGGGYINFLTSNGEDASTTPIVVSPDGSSETFFWDTNMTAYLDDLSCSVSYGEGGEGWLQNILVTRNGIVADVAESFYPGEREATITVTYTPAAGGQGGFSSSCKVKQGRPSLVLPFDQIRALATNEGTTALTRDMIEGYIISVPNHVNIETNPHSDYKTIDYSLQPITAYIQSADGKYGFRLVCADAATSNKLKQYSKVKMALAGLDMVREDNPVRYTLKGVSAVNLLEVTNGTESDIVKKELTIGQLTDNDIYTWVTLKDVELAFKFGSWSQLHEGHIGTAVNTNMKTDCTTRYLHDTEGNKLPMLFNTKVTWRREGVNVPEGSGDVSGILVHSLLSNYNGNKEMGKYQLRVLERSNIKLSTTSKYTKIVEWAWPNKTWTLVKAGDNSAVKPIVGSGSMSTDAVLDANNPTCVTNFIGVTTGTPYPNTALRWTGKWWNGTTDEGRYVSWQFSTAGMSGSHLTMVMTSGVGNQAFTTPYMPVYWNVEYSTDGGATFTKHISELLIYPAPLNACTYGAVPSGLAEYVLELPSSLLGKDDVIVRIKGANRKSFNEKGIDAYTFGKTAATSRSLRFDAVTFKYVK